MEFKCTDFSTGQLVRILARQGSLLFLYWSPLILLVFLLLGTIEAGDSQSVYNGLKRDWLEYLLLMGLMALIFALSYYSTFRSINGAFVVAQDGRVIIERKGIKKEFSGSEFERILISGPFPKFLRRFGKNGFYSNVLLLKSNFGIFNPVIVRLEKEERAAEFAKALGKELGLKVYKVNAFGFYSKVL